MIITWPTIFYETYCWDMWFYDEYAFFRHQKFFQTSNLSVEWDVTCMLNSDKKKILEKAVKGGKNITALLRNCLKTSSINICYHQTNEVKCNFLSL